MLFRRFNVSSRAQRIILSVAALALAVLIASLQGEPGAARDAAPSPFRDGGSAEPDARRPAADSRSPDKPDAAPADDPQSEARRAAVAKAIRWLEAQEGGEHRGHTIQRHVGRTDSQLHDRVERENISAASGFTDLETAAVAIVRTIRHEPNDARVRRWLNDDESQRRLALRRLFDRPVGRIVYRGGDARDGRTTVAVLTKWQDKGRTTYRLLTAYVEP